MVQDDISAITSPGGSIGGGNGGFRLDLDPFADDGALCFGATRFPELKGTLAVKAMARTVLSGGYDGLPVVKSPPIERMLDAYRIEERGSVVVMCAPEDSGKTRAAEFLMNGNYPYRPQRALMVSAASMKDFEKDFAIDHLGVEHAAGSLGEILCSALSGAEDRLCESGVTRLVAFAETIVASAMCQSNTREQQQQSIQMYGADQICNVPVGFQGLSMLIIDNFNEPTDRNKVFIKKLLQEASQFHVFVFVLTSNEDWATTLVTLSGGNKIKPLYGNVDNPDYIITDPFRGIPIWNTLAWSVDALRELVRPMCDKTNIDVGSIIPDGAQILPKTAITRALAAIRA